MINSLERLFLKFKKRHYQNDTDYQYIELVKKILREGTFRPGRNGNTYSIFGHQMRFDLEQGLPILTTKKVITRAVIHELIWLLRGDTSAKYLIDNNVKIWDLWIKDGDLPYTYPRQWRHFPNPHGEPIDQIARAIHDLKNNPASRRIIVSAWNPAEIDIAALPACHSMFQFYVVDGRLSCQLYQRSCDAPIGLSFNLVSYALLVHVFAQICGLKPGEFIWTGGDVHIYENQIPAIKEQLKRRSHKLPRVEINPKLTDIDKLTFDDITIVDYVSEPFLKIPVSE